MKLPSSGLRWALFGSLLLHLALLLPLAEFSFDTVEAETTRIEARLLPPPPPPPPVPAKKPRPANTPQPAASVPAAVAPVAAVHAAAAPAAAAPEPPPAPVTPVAAMPARSLPGSGQLLFDVSKGEGRFPVGRATHRWSIEGNSYMIRSHIETTGIVALFADVQLEQASTGRLDAGGLVPHMFHDVRKGKEQVARFDWDEQRLVLGDGRQLALMPGAQDLLSMIYQFALLPLDSPGFSLMVTNGRKLVEYRFAVEAAEVTLAEDSTLAAWHIRYQGQDGEGIEVWLARDQARLPLRIRYIDRKGGITELHAREINYQGKE